MRIKGEGSAIAMVTFVFSLCVAIVTSNAHAQNMPHEVGIIGAHQGQLRLEAESQANRGFFQNPDIGHLYFNFVSNGVQSLGVFLESLSETRSRNGVWSDLYVGNHPNQYDAHIEENLGLTILGLETARNFFAVGDLRLGGIIGLGYGFGGVEASVRRLSSDTTNHYSSAFGWQGFLISFALRARYSVYISSTMDVGIIAGARYWGFPYLGPIAPSTDYTGPDFRSANDIGYIAGIAIGF